MKIEIDAEAVDRLITFVLRDQILSLKQDIKAIKRMKNPPAYKLEDLANNKKYLEAMRKVYEYYGGEKEWMRIDNT